MVEASGILFYSEEPMDDNVLTLFGEGFGSMLLVSPYLNSNFNDETRLGMVQVFLEDMEEWEYRLQMYKKMRQDKIAPIYGVINKETDSMDGYPIEGMKLVGDISQDYPEMAIGLLVTLWLRVGLDLEDGSAK